MTPVLSESVWDQFVDAVNKAVSGSLTVISIAFGVLAVVLVAVAVAIAIKAARSKKGGNGK